MPTLTHRISLLSVLVMAVLACNLHGLAGEPTVPPAEPTLPSPEDSTSPPVEEPERGTKRLLAQLPSNEIVIINHDGTSSPFANPGFSISAGVYFTTEMADDAYYTKSHDAPGGPHVYAIDTTGAHPLDFPSEDTQHIAIWPGDGTLPPSIAWGDTDWEHSPPLAALWVAPIEGFDVTKVAELSTPEGSYLVPLQFSADGQRLYYSREPSGLGGYILFPGFSSLFVYNLADNTSKELIPTGSGIICHDDISPDEQLVAQHCGGGVFVKNLQTGQTTGIDLPLEVAGEVGIMGSVRFNPEGTRLAFGLARGNMDDEQGWAAVTDALHGASRIVATAPAGLYYTVMAWLDNDTLILQTHGSNPVIWLVGLDGAVRQHDGTFLALVD